MQLQIFSGGNYTNVNGVGSSGPAFHANVPLVESLPGAPDASVERIDVKVGGARKSGKKTHYYGTLPKKCPKHYLPVATELTFWSVEYPLGSGVFLPETHVKAEYHAPCPKRH